MSTLFSAQSSQVRVALAPAWDCRAIRDRVSAVSVWSRPARCACSGTVFTNCAGQGGGYCVNNDTGGWEQCAAVPQAQQQRLTLQELGASDQGLPARGAPGGFCIPNTAEQLAGMASGCREGLACIPLPVGPPSTANVRCRVSPHLTLSMHLWPRWR